MFKGMEKKRIPKTIAECIEPNATVVELNNWANKIETWGNILFWFVAAIGAIVTVIVCVNASNWEDFLTSFLVLAFATVMCVIVEYGLFHFIALRLSALASITQNTAVSANVALFQAMKENESNSQIEMSTMIDE